MDYFYVGKKFSSYDELQAVVQRMKEETKAEFNIRNSNKKGRKIMFNQALNYHYIKLACIRGGREFISRGKGVRNRKSLKVGCNAFILLTLTHCGQYLQVTKLCLDHNHNIELRPPSKMEKRAERRRQRLMERMKVSYEEAVILERLKVSPKHGLVGPLGEDYDIYEKSSESSDNFESEKTDLTSNSKSDLTVYTSDKNNAYKQSEIEEQIEDENNRFSMDMTYSNSDSDQDCDTTLQQIISSVKKNKEANQTDTNQKEDEHCISDDEDYRRPLIIPGSKNQPKKEDDASLNYSDYSESEPNIFTRKGDDGMASTYSGIRKYKDDEVFEALGTIEELSSSIGYAKELLPVFCTDISSELIEVQCVLQDMVIHVGTPRRSCTEFHRVNSQFPETHVKHLEDLITHHETRLPKANSILLPSGGQSSCSLHVARAICRRAERRVVCLVREGEVDRTVTCYLNRLGDYLFVAARIASFISGKKECIYTKPSYNSSPNTSVNTSVTQGYSIIYVQQPALQQSALQQPVYQQPVYQQPVFQQPVQ